MATCNNCSVDSGTEYVRSDIFCTGEIGGEKTKNPHIMEVFCALVMLEHGRHYRFAAFRRFGAAFRFAGFRFATFRFGAALRTVRFTVFRFATFRFGAAFFTAFRRFFAGICFHLLLCAQNFVCARWVQRILFLMLCVTIFLQRRKNSLC